MTVKSFPPEMFDASCSAYWGQNEDIWGRGSPEILLVQGLDLAVLCSVSAV